jgi:5-methylcytosine-specific restriction enzyme A
MEEFVQYHNPDYSEFPEETSEPFSIYTTKRVDNVGARVWLVARKADTSEYYLVYWFIVDDISHGQSGEPGHISGVTGHWFRPALRIDNAPWFRTLRDHLGNFAFGLRRVTDPTLRDTLVSLEEADAEPYDDQGDPTGNVAFSMDYARALERIRDTLSVTQVDLLSALCAAPGNELSAGQIARLLGLSHHAALNGAIVRLAKALTTAVEVEPPRRTDGSARWWHVVAEGRYPEDRSRFFWRLRPLLRDAALATGICSVDRGTFADELEGTEGRLFEGAGKVIRVNIYERNPVARRRCIEHYGATCAVCCFDFAAAYGAIAEGIIHVHHLRPISECGGEDYEVDPVAELRPVCPNCHVVLHRCQPPFSIEELQDMLARQRSQLLSAT